MRQYRRARCRRHSRLWAGDTALVGGRATEGALQVTPPIAGLWEEDAIVSMRPPLSASSLSSGPVPLSEPFAVPKPQLAPEPWYDYDK